MHKIYLSLLLASTIGYSQTVNFDDVLQQTIKNSKDLQQQKLNVDLAKQDTKTVDFMNYGKVSIGEEMSRTNHAGYVFNSKLSSREATFNDFGAGEFAGPSSLMVEPKNLNYPDARNNYNTKLTYDIPLFTGFKLSNQKDILVLMEKANELKYNLDRKNIEFETLKAYNSAVVAKEFVKALEKAKETLSFMVKAANAFHNEGLVTKIDVNEAKVYELNINSQLTEAKNNFQLALAYLKFLTSNDEITDVQTLENIHFNLPNQQELYEKAMQTRDEVKMQNIEVEATKKNIDIAKSSYYPTIFSHLEYGFNDDKITTNEDKDYYIALVGLSLSLFDGTRGTQVEKSRLEHLKATLNQEKLKDGIKLEIEKAILDLETKQTVLAEKSEAKNLASEVLEQAKLQYKNRLISMTVLLQQEANYRKYEALLINAKYEKSLALAKVNLVLGKNLKEENE